MTRIKAAVFILIVIAAMCTGSLFIIKNHIAHIEQITESITSALDDNDTQKAAEYADEALEYWRKSSIILNSIVRSDRASPVYISLTKLRPLIENDSDGIYAEIRSINAQLEFIYKSELPYICNIF